MSKPAPQRPMPPRRPRRPPGIGVAALAIAAALSACSSDPGAPTQSAVTPHDVTLTSAQQRSIRLYTVARSTFHTSIDTTGVVDFDHDRSTVVLAPFSGPVTKLWATLGERVRKGQALAVVDSPDFAAAVAAYRKTLAAARAAAQLASTDRDLFAHHALSQRENAQAQSDAVGAASDRDSALQALRALRVDPRTIHAIQQGRAVADAHAIIRAPMAGTVVEKSVAPGQLLQAGSTPCFTVADLSRVWVMARVFGSDIGAVAPGDAAEVEIGDDGMTLPGKVEVISAEVDPDTRSAAARVVVANPGDLLKKQMYVRVRIRSSQARSGVLVPVSAVLRDDENLPFVYVARANGTYARRPVTLGVRTDGRYQIEHGLSPGDRVVVEGGIFVRFIETQ